MDFTALTVYLDSLEKKFGLPGYCMVAMRDHEIIYSYCHGYRDHAKKEPVTLGTWFDVYSATKVVTMTAVLQLLEKGKLNLEQDVADFLPEFRDMKVLNEYDLSAFPYPKLDLSAPCHPKKGPITLRHLMTMTAGLSYELDNDILLPLSSQNADTQTIVRSIAKMPLLYEPGSHYRYSLGHDVMAAVVEIASGKSFSEYLQDHIFAPLGLKNMTLHPGITEVENMMEKWQFQAESETIIPFPMENVFRMGNNYDSGGAGLSCTPEDYCRFLDALACGGTGNNGVQILQPKTVKLFSQPQLNEQQQRDFGRGELGYSYGLGVRVLVYPEKSRSPVGEFGWDGAAGAFVLADTTNRISLFFAPEVMRMPKIYFDVHPVLRDIFYQCLLG